MSEAVGTRDQVIQLRVSTRQRGLWKRAAEQQGLSLSEWIRAALNAEANSTLPPVRTKETDEDILAPVEGVAVTRFEFPPPADLGSFRPDPKPGQRKRA